MTTLPARFTTWFDDLDPFLVVARLGLFVAIVNNHSYPRIAVGLGVVTAVLYFEERWLRSPWPWLAIVAVLGWVQIQEWWLIDDHPVATTYWLLAIGVSRFGRRPDDVLALSARLLIGTLFALAFGWKLLSGPFVAGEVFEYTLVRDHRFEPVTTSAGGIDEHELAQGRATISDLTSNGDVGDFVEVPTGPRTPDLAVAFTWFGLISEGAVAAAFLAPLRGRWTTVRAAVLIGFCLTTYAVVPIAGFAVLLLTMGLAHSRSSGVRRAHIAAGMVILAWNTVLAGAVL